MVPLRSQATNRPRDCPSQQVAAQYGNMTVVRGGIQPNGFTSRVKSEPEHGAQGRGRVRAVRCDPPR